MSKRFLTGAEIILQFLKDKKVDTVFGYPGGAVLPLYDALYNFQEINHVLVRHEQGATHMAEGYAKFKNTIGVVFVTSGPGATNTITGLADAYMDSIPLFVISGQVNSPMIGTDAFQEADIIGITRPITKWNTNIETVNELEEKLHFAYSIAMSGKKGPVLIDIPKDVLLDKTDFPKGYKNNDLECRPKEKFDFSVIKEQLRKAKKPLIYFGGGVIQSGAADVLISIAEELNIPATSTLHGIGAFPSNHNLYLGMLGMHGFYHANKAIDECDLLLALGARFDDRVTGATKEFSKKSFKIHVDIDVSNMNKVVIVDYSIQANLSDWLVAFSKEEKPVPNTKKWVEEITTWKKSIESDVTPLLTAKAIFYQWSEFTDGLYPVVSDVGQNQMWTAQYLSINQSGYHITSGGLGTMGFSLPAAIGVSFAHKGSKILSINGDGGFQMNIQELITAVYYKSNIVIIILNNSSLGMVRQWQDIFHDKRFSFTDLSLSNPDFIKLAKALSIPALRVTDQSEIGNSIEWAHSLPDGPSLIEYKLQEDLMVYPMIPSNSHVKHTLHERFSKDEQ